jgi:hypothetical protein
MAITETISKSNPLELSVQNINFVHDVPNGGLQSKLEKGKRIKGSFLVMIEATFLVGPDGKLIKLEDINRAGEKYKKIVNGDYLLGKMSEVDARQSYDQISTELADGRYKIRFNPYGILDVEIPGFAKDKIKITEGVETFDLPTILPESQKTFNFIDAAAEYNDNLLPRSVEFSLERYQGIFRLNTKLLFDKRNSSGNPIILAQITALDVPDQRAAEKKYRLSTEQIQDKDYILEIHPYRMFAFKQGKK